MSLEVNVELRKLSLQATEWGYLIMSGITNIGLKNFKSFESTEIAIPGKINLIMGENSSGKSSIIKSILSLKQTLSQYNEHEVFAANGEYVELGTYNDYVYQHNDSNEIEISLTIDNMATRDSFWWMPLEIEREYLENHQEEYKREIAITYDKDYKTSQSRLKKVYMKTHAPVIGELEFTLERMKTRDHFSLNINKSSFETIKENYIKHKALFFSNIRTEKINNLDYTSTTKHLRIEQKNRLELDYKVVLANNNGNGYDLSTDIFHLFNNHYNEILKEIESNIYYLGPIRSSPLRSYKRTSHNRSIGINGVHSASVLANLHAGKSRIEKSKLNTFNEWVNILFPETVVDIESYDELVKLKFSKKNRKNIKGESIPDVGFGFSQILPFLIQAAVLTKDNILIIEQPELHLHPG